MSQIRPISLSTVFYKIISKVLVHRLQPLMNKIISDNQSVFIRGRLISDNILVAHECMHFLKNKSFGGTDLALKVDMSKAYDRVEWSFVWFIMKKLGFCQRWIEWVKECVTTISYSVIVENSPIGFFKSSRGLRQGDPLSPYLFLLCAEGLSFLLHKGEQDNLFQGLRLNSRCPSINHLLFADDSLLFCKATPHNCASLINVIQQYGSLSGQIINFSKSAVFFSKNTPHAIKEEIANFLRVPNIGAQDKYLGLPSIVNRSKSQTFAYVKDKVSKKLQGWKRQLLSASGREILIKAVGCAIPIYTLSCFKLPESLLDDIHKMMMQFWWGQKQNEKKLQWISWDTMSRIKEEGGMGFKDLKAFNLAMLAKQGWRLMTKPNSLFYKVFKSKYFRLTSFLGAKPGLRPSWAWQSLLEGRKVLEQGTKWKVTTQGIVKFKEDPWFGNSPPFRVQEEDCSDENLIWLRQLFNEIGGWNTQLIHSKFSPNIAQQICQMDIEEGEDSVRWIKHDSGQYNVRTGYEVAYKFFHKPMEDLHARFQSRQLWRSIWEVRCQPKIKTFLWKFAHEGLAVKTNLHKRIPHIPNLCPRCSSLPETHLHALIFCPGVVQVWNQSPVTSEIPRDPTMEPWEWWCQLMEAVRRRRDSKEKISQVSYLLWQIWLSRNALIFENGRVEVGKILSQALTLAEEFGRLGRHSN